MLNKPEYYFILNIEHYVIVFLTIKCLWLFNMSDLSIALKSTEKLYTFPFRDTSLDSPALSPFEICFLDKIGLESQGLI